MKEKKVKILIVTNIITFVALIIMIVAYTQVVIQLRQNFDDMNKMSKDFFEANERVNELELELEQYENN
jgi:uncharacterized membrane protein